MNLCSNGHEEICFESRKCPVCIIIGEHESEIEDLKWEIDSLKSEIEDLKSEAISNKEN